MTATEMEKPVSADKIAHEKSWLWEHLALMRRSQRSNVFIAQTRDALVKKEFLTLAKDTEKITTLLRSESCKEENKYREVYYFDLQRNEAKILTTNSIIEEDPLKEMDVAALAGPTVGIIDYVFMQSHADSISDYLAAWSQDQRLYEKKSTIIVFTSNINLFNQTLRELCYTFVIPASTDRERLEIGTKTAAEITIGVKAKYGKVPKIAMTEELVQASRGLNKQQVQTALMIGFFQDRRFKVENFTELKTAIVAGHGLQYVEPKSGFEQIGGYEIYKKYIRDRVIAPLRDPEKAARYGITIPRGFKLIRQ